MTEAEWSSDIDPIRKLEFLNGTASERKLRLYAVACCRRIWHLYGDQTLRHAVEVAEAFVEGDSSLTDVIAATEAAHRIWQEADRDKREIAKRIDGRFLRDRYPSYVAARKAAAVAKTVLHFSSDALEAAHGASLFSRYAAGDVSPRSLWPIFPESDPEGAAQDRLLRDIFANPYHPVIPNPAWRTSVVVKTADAIYYENGFDTLPVLAEVLEEAGCNNIEILEHCRRGGDHVRGCWVVDMILGKE